LEDIGSQEEPTARHISALNRFILTTSLIRDPLEALEKAVPALSQAGMTRGLVIKMHGDQVEPILGWGLSSRVMERDPHVLARFLTPDLAPTLQAMPSSLTAVDTSDLGGPLAIFGPWIAGGLRQLFAMTVPTPTPADHLTLVGGWEVKEMGDQAVQALVSDIIRKIAGAF
jgi:hypothetical protein